MINKNSKWYEDLENAIIDADIENLFKILLTIAVDEWASDIHIEIYSSFCRIRLRIDGILEELTQYPVNIHETIIAKFKIESGQMRSDEKRLPQDARVSTTTLEGKEIDLRANTLPTVFGEKLVMRIVDKSKKIPPLEVLGIEWINGLILKRNLQSPNGIILTTWPTGSWKSTTLYSALSTLNKVDVNITTYEDPVENKMDWLNQSQVRWDIGYTFASWLRAALRQDPDIIMVWEIRDEETLETAMEAAMTWHLVFSTIHTNSAAETITRVFNMGAKPYMLAGTFNLVMAQRLWRKICDHCKIEYNVKQDNPELYRNMMEALQTMKPEHLKREIKLRKIPIENWNKFTKEWILFIGSGKDKESWEVCPVCWGSWEKWRVWLYEFMEYDDDLRQKILDGASALEVEKYALKEKWMVNLERDGIFKAIKWLINPNELYRLVKHK